METTRDQGFLCCQVAAQAGQRVHLVDIDSDAVGKAQQRINESIKRVAKKKFKVSSLYLLIA